MLNVCRTITFLLVLLLGTCHFSRATGNNSCAEFALLVENTSNGNQPRGSELPLSQMFYFWGQLVFHDLAGTPALDGSVIYGNNDTTTDALRLFSKGKMKTTAGFNELPRICDPYIIPKKWDPDKGPDSVACAGDYRSSQTIGLLSLETMLIREHNYQCDRFVRANPSASDAYIFTVVQRYMIALIQKITLYEWLPIILGQNPPDYNPSTASRNGSIVLPETEFVLRPFLQYGAVTTRAAYDALALHAIAGISDGVCASVINSSYTPFGRLGWAEYDAQLNPADQCEDWRANGTETFSQAEHLEYFVDPSGASQLNAFTIDTDDTELLPGLLSEVHGPTDDDIMGPLAHEWFFRQFVLLTRDADPRWFELLTEVSVRDTLWNVVIRNCVRAPISDALGELEQSVLGAFQLTNFMNDEMASIINNNNNNVNQMARHTSVTEGGLIFAIVIIGIMTIVAVVFLYYFINLLILQL